MLTLEEALFRKEDTGLWVSADGMAWTLPISSACSSLNKAFMMKAFAVMLCQPGRVRITEFSLGISKGCQKLTSVIELFAN